MARSPSIRAALEQAKAEIIRIGRDAAPSLIDDKGNARRRAAQNMAKRFRQHAEAYFAFITTPGMVQTNNVAKQAIRFVIIDRHVTQGTRGANGRRANERLWTVIATRALQGRSAFAFTLDAVGATYPMTRVDADGEPLDSSKHRNRLTFASGELPPVNAHRDGEERGRVAHALHPEGFAWPGKGIELAAGTGRPHVRRHAAVLAEDRATVYNILRRRHLGPAEYPRRRLMAETR